MHLIYLLCLLLLASCKSSPKSSQEHILHLNIQEDPVSFDPRLVQALRDLTVMRQLYEGLYRMDQGGPRPALAEQTTLSSDGLTYTFTLRAAKWSNGDWITAHDFVRSWSQALNPEFPCSYAYMLFPIKNAKLVRSGKAPVETLGILARDDRTLVVHLERPTPYFLELTAFPTFFPVNARSAYCQGLVSSGPFSLLAWNTSDQLKLQKNPAYWDADHVYLDGIDFSIINDSQTESFLFEKGKLHWLGQPISNEIAPELLSQLRQEGKLRSYDVDGTFWFKINVHAAPFHNKDLRKAFACALNREEMIRHILGGGQKPALSPIPPSMELNIAPVFKDGDVEQARRLFERALGQEGWTRETLPQITLRYAATERNAKLAQVAQQQWQEAFGIRIHLEAMESTLYRRRTKLGDYQIGTGEWVADFHDPIAFLELFKEVNIDGVGMNDTGWQNEDYTALLESSAEEKDLEIRTALLKSAEHLLMEAMPIIPLYHYAFDYVKKEEVDNVVLSPLGTTDFKSTRV